jgi:hypothetical protein
MRREAGEAGSVFDLYSATLRNMGVDLRAAGNHREWWGRVCTYTRQAGNAAQGIEYRQETEWPIKGTSHTSPGEKCPAPHWSSTDWEEKARVYLEVLQDGSEEAQGAEQKLVSPVFSDLDSFMDGKSHSLDRAVRTSDVLSCCPCSGELRLGNE